EFGVAPEDIHAIPTGIDMAQIRGVDPVPGGDIVFSRRLDEASNLETLLLGLAEFREYDWGVTIIGDGPRRADFERQAADLRIADRVEFVGEKPLEDRLAFFKDAHVYVHTAEYTPFAIELLRALASGCVGIVEYQEDSSAHELVEQEERGFLATSAEELTERLVQARNLERLTVDGAFEPYDQATFVKRYEELYRSLGT
ncbi:MAG: glycosyltransferase, partial [Halodesulfurarchaeum sp.]